MSPLDPTEQANPGEGDGEVGAEVPKERDPSSVHGHDAHAVCCPRYGARAGGSRKVWVCQDPRSHEEAAAVLGGRAPVVVGEGAGETAVRVVAGGKSDVRYSLGIKYTRATPPIRLSVGDTPSLGKWFVGICSRAGDG